MKFFLIGFMGAGKSTIGKYAARENGLEFLDLDRYIETEMGQEIRTIFREKGESYFRELEKVALNEVIAMDRDLLVSCGGGTPCFFDNMDRMNAAGVTLYLDLSAGRLTDRLRNAKSKRPLISQLKGDLQVWIHQKLLERAEFYGQAQIIVPEGDSHRKPVSTMIGQMIAGNPTLD